MKSNFYYDPETIRRVLGSTSGTWYHNEPLITTITTSSTEAEKNSLFVPLLGNRDGHEFIRDAISKGATYFLVEEHHPIYKDLNIEEKSRAIPVKNTLTALGKLAAFHRSRFNPIVIAITGSSGKTTTKEFLGNCLKNLEESALVVTEKNYNNEIGLPFTLFKISNQTRVVVCELGMNHKGEISRLGQIAKPDYAIITTIGTAHIEFLGSQKNIAKAKGEITEGLKKEEYYFIQVQENILKYLKIKLVNTETNSFLQNWTKHFLFFKKNTLDFY